MSINREAIHKGLFTKLQALVDSGAIKTLDRKLRHFNEVQPEEMPYLCMVARNQRRTQAQQHTPGKYTLPVDLYLYVTSKGDDEVPATRLNITLDAIDAALEPPHNHPVQTLDVPGVVRAWVEGEIQTDEGTLGDIAAAVVPVEILAVG